MRLCTVTLTGVSPYSQSRQIDDEEFPLKEKENRLDFEKRIWPEKATYNDDGHVCIPAGALKMAISIACKRLSISIPGQGKAKYTARVESGVICTGDVSLGITRDDLKPVKLWQNADGVRGSGKRVQRIFPVVNKWQAEAEFAILDDIIPNDVFEKSLIEAGRLIGIGRWRPEKGGMNGRFDATDFKWSEH